MPIYEYECEACGHEHEAIQKFSDAPLTLCPECGREAMKRLISRTSFVLKGDGWYVTDYGRGAAGKAGKGDAGGGGGGGDKAAASGKDPAPAAKPEPKASPTPSGDAS